MEKIGTLLREARESKEISIRDAAKALKLRERHIKMLENGELNELSREIYLKGFLKTYTKWLNIDGGEVLTQVNKEKKKLTTHQKNTVPVVTVGFSYISDLARRPGLNVFLLSTILVMVIYTFWYSNHKNLGGSDMILSLDTKFQNQQDNVYSNITSDYIGQDLVLFSHNIANIQVVETLSEREKLYKLQQGDVIFLKINSDTVISSETPEEIEVFIDNEGSQKSLGTLKDIFIKFDDIGQP